MIIPLTSEQTVTIILAASVLLVPALRKIFFYASDKTATEKVTERLIFFDIARGVAILAVIGIHIIQFFIEAHPESAGRETSHFVINNILRFAVPVFFICSGTLLNPFSITTREGLIQFYTRKLVRIFIPYIFCSIAVDLFKESTINTLLWNIMAGRALPPYYFMTVLFQLYLIYPLLVRWRNKSWFLPVIFALSVCSFFQSQTWWFFGISTFLPYLYFFAWGIAKRDDYLSGERGYIKTDLFVFILIIFYLGFCIFRPEYYFNMRYIYGIAVFHLLYLAAVRIKISSLRSSIGILGKHSLWIYLIHFPITYGMFLYLRFSEYPYYGKMGIIYCLAVVASLVYALLLSRGYRLLFYAKLMRNQYDS